MLNPGCSATSAQHSRCPPSHSFVAKVEKQNPPTRGTRHPHKRLSIQDLWRMNVINERFKKIVEPANILLPGQGGGRQGRCVGINMQKVHFIQQEAWRQGKRVCRVDIDFKNAFNAMSQTALWRVIKINTSLTISDLAKYCHVTAKISAFDAHL